MTHTLPVDCKTMSDVRSEIDRLDRQLMELFAERSRYIDRAAAIKKKTCETAHIGWRVEEVAQNARRNAETHQLDADFAEKLWRSLIDWSIAREDRHLNGDSG